MARFFRSIKRWWRKQKASEDQQRTVNDNHLPTNLPEPRKDGDDYKSWIDGAENIHATENIKMRSRDEYRYGYPEGLVVHFHSGWHLPKGIHLNPFPLFNRNLNIAEKARDYALRCARYGAKQGYNYLTMDVLGKLYQSRPLIKHGYHAGKSYWPGVGHSVSKRFAGVEMINPSSLKLKNGNFITWFKYVIPSKLVRHTPDGYFHEYSREQEDSLLKRCVWLYKNSPVVNGKKVFKIENIVGHSEVSPGRKSDPCGALSVSMTEFRAMVTAAINK